MIFESGCCMMRCMERQEWLDLQKEAREHAPQTHREKTDAITIVLLAEILEQLWQANHKDSTSQK